MGKKYTQDDVDRAVSLVQSKKITVWEACKSFHIPHSTLRDKIKGRWPVKPAPRYLLEDKEEEQLVEWIKMYKERSMDRTGNDIKNKAKEILELRGAKSKSKEGRPCKIWLKGFRQRHPEISLSTRPACGKTKAVISVDGAKSWFQTLKSYLDLEDPTLLKSPHRILNADEIGFALCPKTKRVLPPTVPTANSTRQKITVMGCSSASGEFTPPLIVYPRKSMPSKDLLNGFEDAHFRTSSNGWISSGIFMTWLRDIFIPFVKDREKPVVLFVNGYSYLTSDLSALELCHANGIILYGIHSNASSIVQPLHVAVFENMNVEWRNVTQRHLKKEHEMPSVRNFASLLQSVWLKCIQPQKSVYGFMKSGLHPFNPGEALSHDKRERSQSSVTTSPTALTSQTETSPSFTAAFHYPASVETATTTAATRETSMATICNGTETTLKSTGLRAKASSSSMANSASAAISTSTAPLNPTSSTAVKPTHVVKFPARNCIQANTTHQTSAQVTRLSTNTLNQVGALINLSFRIGGEKCDTFLSAMKGKMTSEDSLFKSFETAVLNLAKSSVTDVHDSPTVCVSTGMTALPDSAISLESELATRAPAPQNSTTTITAAVSCANSTVTSADVPALRQSLNIAYGNDNKQTVSAADVSCQGSQQLLKRTEDRSGNECEGTTKRRKTARREMMEKRLREKEERKEKERSDKARERQEKRMLVETKKVEQTLRVPEVGQAGQCVKEKQEKIVEKEVNDLWCYW